MTVSETGTHALYPEMGIWTAAWKLMRLRAVIGWNGFRRAKLRRKIVLLFAGVGIAFILGVLVFLSISILIALRSPLLSRYIGDTRGFVESFPVLLLTSATIGILLTSFGVMLQALYLSGDMDFLMSAPIPVRSIFIAKLLQGILPNFAILCLFTLPLLFGLGVSGNYSLLYYPLTLLVLAALTLAAGGLAALLVMVAARFFPARRLAEVLGFVVGTFFFAFSQSMRFIKFDVQTQDVSSMLSMVQRFNRPWSPISWTGNGLVLLGKSQWLPGLASISAGLLIAFAIFFLSLVAAERMYYSGWSSLQNNRGRKKKSVPIAASAALPAAALERTPEASAAASAPAPNMIARLIPKPMRAIIVKDWLLYRRDLRNASRMITPLILGVVYAASLLRSGGQFPAGRGEAPEIVLRTLESIYVYADVGLAIFIGWMFAANIAGLGFSMEGKRYWMLKMAPISSRTLLAAKFLTAYLPSLVLCGIYVITIQVFKGANLWNMAVSLLAVAAIMAGLTGIHLAFGVAGARFDWDNPNEVGRTIGCFGGLAGMIYAGLCFFLFAAPAIAAGLLELPVWLGQLVGLALGVGAGVAAVLIPLGLVEKRVATLMEA